MFRLTANAPDAQPIFAAAAHVLGHDPRDLVSTAENGDLFTNLAGQILCCTQALAAWNALTLDTQRPIILAGYSVGEVAAWGCAGIFSPDQIFDLIRQRVLAMNAAAPADSGLAAIVGLRRGALDTILGAHGGSVAIVNGDDSFVVGGTSDELDACVAEARAAHAKTARRLAVSVPSHTPILLRASEAFQDALKNMPKNSIRDGVTLLSGLDGDVVRRPAVGYGLLARQISETIQWSDCLETCLERGAETFLELGPGRALSHMVEKMPTGIRARSLEDFHALDGIGRWIGDGTP